MKKRHLAIYLILFLTIACNENNKEKNKSANEQVQKTEDAVNDGAKQYLTDSLGIQQENASVSNQKDHAEVWLKNIFKTKRSNQYFPEYNVEEKLCTKRFQEFIAESGEIYGPSNLTDLEYSGAEKRYKDKWSKIYPIEEREMWLFGRGNGDIGELKQLKISHITEGLYHVFIDYGDGIKTQNEVTLVTENGNYKIDYCKTEFLE